MIPDWETNQLFISDRLEIKFPDLVFSLRTALTGTTICTIPDTSDIWCRDYMPIQLDESRFCQFVYAPDYLRGYENLITPPSKCRLHFMTDCHQEPIVLDGGNIVASRTKVILTDKIYKENPTIKRPRLRERLAQIFQAKCIVIQKEPYDLIGHSDGVVRFVSEDRVLINDYSILDPKYGLRLQKGLEKNGLEVETLPLFQEPCKRRRGELPPAVGIYINYLRVGDVVVVPGYDRDEDHEAMEKIRQAIPGATVFQVPCRNLAEKGGVLNCVSWTIKGKIGTIEKSEV